MERKEILEQLQLIFRDILELDALVLTEELTAGDVDEWDSLNHVQLVVAIERFYKIRFTSLEIQNWKKTGDMVDSIFQRKNS